jgi:hypothetical protein
MLAELTLQRHDVSNGFHGVELPAHLHLLDVSACQFTMGTMLSFFDMISRSSAPLTLVMQDLGFPEDQWRAL